MEGIKWTTKEGKVIDLTTYNDTNHLKNILNVCKTRLKDMPDYELEISGSESDGAWSLDNQIKREWHEYQTIRTKLEIIVDYLTHKLK